MNRRTLLLSSAMSILAGPLHADGRTFYTPGLAEAAMDAHQLYDRLENLRLVLEYDLGQAEPLLAELRTRVGNSPWRNGIASLAARVDVFDIDGARSELRLLQEKLLHAQRRKEGSPE